MVTRLTLPAAAALALMSALAGAAPRDLDQYLPRVYVTSPTSVVGQIGAATLAASPWFTYDGADPDGPTSQPVRIRYLLKPALLPDGNYADSRFEVLENLDDLVPFGDPMWSDWIPWPQPQDARDLRFDDLPLYDDMQRPIYYLFAIQAMDTAGAVSIDRAYGYDLAHFAVRDNAPRLSYYESRLGRGTVYGLITTPEFDVGPGTYEFLFAGDTDEYGGGDVVCRWGLDLVDPDDPDDPGWHDGPVNTTGPLALTSGIRTVSIEARDGSGGVTRLTFMLSIVPIPDLADQLPVLLVDDVYDRASNGWWGPPPANLRFDKDIYRDGFWTAVLTGGGGVAAFDPTRDIVDLEVDWLGFRDLVDYRAVIWTTRWCQLSFVTQHLQALIWDSNESIPYNWLAEYQEQAGNLLLAGSRVADSFLSQANYALPIVFESREGDATGFVSLEGDNYRVGFGHQTQPDGTELWRGELQYPYRDLGLSVLDAMSPNQTYILYGVDPVTTVAAARKRPCVGLKGVVVDPAFAASHSPAFPDTIPSDETIDWRDLDPVWYDDLLNGYDWGDDEFYEYPGQRTTSYTPQACAESPDGLCVEPMLRSMARYDWIRRQHLDADPGDTWPEGYYSQPMSYYCGQYGLADLDSAVTNNRVVGFFSHKNVATKPSGAADVVWGFDPYRMDHAAMTGAIRWVLGEHFGLQMNP